MIVKQELVKKVKDYFDLNIYETKVWLALLSKGIASAGEIAELSGVPRSRTYDVLESLDKRGFAIVKLGKPVKYIGVKPHVILEKLKNNVRKDAEDRIESLSKVKNTEEYQTLEGLYKVGVSPLKSQDLTASIKGKSNISNHIREIIQNAEKEVIVCTNVEEMLSKSKLFSQTFEILKKNNIKVRVALSGNPELIKKAEGSFDVKIQKIDIDAKFFIVDRKEILFYLLKNTSSEEDTAIWLNSDFFAQSFADMFDMALKKGA